MTHSDPQPLQSLTRQQFWKHHIQQWQVSGLSKMRYCRDNELAYHQLIYWCGKSAQSDKTHKAVESNFVSVCVSPVQNKPVATLSLELPNGITITGVNGETMAWVQPLLRTL